MIELRGSFRRLRSNHPDVQFAGVLAACHWNIVTAVRGMVLRPFLSSTL